MKTELSSIDVHVLVRELQEFVGARFQRAYARQGEKELFLALHQTSEGKQLLRIQLPGLMYLASARPDFPQNPPGFVMFVRKKLNGTRIKAIEQLGMDRIIIFTFGKADDDVENTFRLVVELITPGNILLLGRRPIKGGELSEELILSLLNPLKFKDRALRGGIPYEAPPPALNLKTDDETALVKGVLAANMDSIVKSLAVGLSLGGTYAELACKRANIDKNAKPTQELVKKGIIEAKKLLDETPNPKKIKQEIILFSDQEGDEFSTLSEAMDALFTTYEDANKAPTPRKQKGSILDQQAAQKTGFEEAVKVNQRKGELLYEKYQELTPLLAKIKKGENPVHPYIKKIDRATGEVTLEIE